VSDFYAQLEQQLLIAARQRTEQGRLRRSLAGHGRSLAAAGVVAAAIVAAAAVLAAPLQRDAAQQRPAARSAPAVPVSSVATDLSGIRAAILNGTTQTGLARATADILGARHARITFTGNASNQHLAVTEVRHRRGARAQALKVASVLGVGGVHSSTTSRPAVGHSEVVVLVGADRLRGAKPPARRAAPPAPRITRPAP
jgi:hypothetical protein